MPAINITDLSNAQLDVTHIAAIATSTAATATDRLGNVKSTIAGNNATEVTARAVRDTNEGNALSIRNGNESAAVSVRNNNAAVALTNSNAGEFETINPAYSSSDTVILMDAQRKVLATFPDSTTPKNEVFETVGPTTEIPFIDKAGNLLSYLQSRTSLAAALAPVNDRIGRGLTPYGDALGPYANGWSMRDTRMRLRKLAAGDAEVGATNQFNVAFIGDSYTAGGYFTDVIAKALQTQYGFAGSGWTGFAGWFSGTGPWTAVNQPTVINGNIRPDLVPIVQVFGNWVTSTSGANNTPSLESAASSTAGDYARFSKSSGSTVCTLYYCGDGTGVVQVSFDDGATYGANVALTTVGAAHFNLAGTPGAAATARIKVISGNVKLAGVNQWSYSPGVIVHKLGWSGSSTDNWTAADATLWANELGSLGCNAHCIMFGTNDQLRITPDAFASNLGTLVTRIRGVLPYGDVLLATPAENQNTATKPYAMAAFAQAAREYAVPNDLSYLDLQYFFGPATNNGAAYAAANTSRPWAAGDLVHPNALSGGRVIADAFLRLFIQL